MEGGAALLVSRRWRRYRSSWSAGGGDVTGAPGQQEVETLQELRHIQLKRDFLSVNVSVNTERRVILIEMYIIVFK